LQQISHADRQREDGSENSVAGQNQPLGLGAPVGVPDPFPNWWSMLQEVEFTDVGNLWNGMREM